jgi:hypothetical protein
MTRKRHNKFFSVAHPICCGLDIHKNMDLLLVDEGEYNE